MSEIHRFGDDELSATVSEAGAELQSLQDASGQEWLWQAGPAWPRRAPILFPIVGKLPGDVLRHDGRAYRMTQHGFARDRTFAWIRRDRTGAALRLCDDEATREVFPFPFTLDVAWEVAQGALSCSVTVSNSGPTTLPFSLGAHPAFAWPLPGAPLAEGHSLSFPDFREENLHARRLNGGLLDSAEIIPLADGVLPLHPDLFEADAIVLPAFPGRLIRYSAPGGTALEMAWDGYGDLGIWSRPGAAFLCIEPWNGTAAPLGWDDAFSTKPGVTLLDPGGSRVFRWFVRFNPRPG
ncbi:aldose 1-epimerase family protein [Roseomonas sp. SSH11]|uniref:Aldose 1-epimerase family protein n=1 Tax=Pararoseomonas baculiformis TaxID=2820812 RepID=A0ABS4ABG5_9PROT|nr:aldose 1-epimerase family protein [Pararoseomonas baculiformis]MBP0444345.1 aldose 1-epimerase family protein [Pararoseomonas baculiformis]